MKIRIIEAKAEDDKKSHEMIEQFMMIIYRIFFGYAARTSLRQRTHPQVNSYTNVKPGVRTSEGGEKIPFFPYAHCCLVYVGLARLVAKLFVY